jgi:hypothetical protein
MTLTDAIMRAKDIGMEFIELNHGPYQGRTVMSISPDASNYYLKKDSTIMMDDAVSEDWQVME